MTAFAVAACVLLGLDTLYHLAHLARPHRLGDASRWDEAVNAGLRGALTAWGVALLLR